MLNPAGYENSLPGGLSVLAIEGDPPRFVPLTRTELHGEIAGPLASLRLVQVFCYTRGQCDHVLEAIYRFPLPGDAAIRGVRVTFGEVEIEATLAEREQAEHAYEDARRHGQQAALLSREAPDVFTLRVTGIGPDQPVTIETRYAQLARAEGAGWSLRLPLTTAPRYVRGDELASRHAQGQPLALLRDPGHRFSLDLRLRGAAAVASPTHPLDLADEAGATRVQLQGDQVIPDRDLVLTWQAHQERDRPALRIWTHDEAAAGQLYLLALVTPPSASPLSPISREVILLVDHSGSMQGAKWEAADWAVTRFLSDLAEGDHFNLGLFHNTTRWFAPAPRQASEAAVASAIAFLQAHRDSGGTNLGVALEQGLAMARQPGRRARHVLIVTDAAVTDDGRILRLADTEWRRPDHRRISVLCIDAAPNAFLAYELAERGGGIARFLTSAPEEEDIATALDAVLEDWAQPAAIGLRLLLDRPTAEAAGRQVQRVDGEHVAIDLGDLPAGRALWLVARTPRDGAGPLGCRLEDGDGTMIADASASEQQEAEALPALFGARRVLALEHLAHALYGQEELAAQLARLGYDPHTVLAGEGAPPPAVYAENTRAAQERLLRGLVAREALAFGLASSETAFVAVRREQGHEVEAVALVANALPAGWSGAFFAAAGAFPAGAPVPAAAPMDYLSGAFLGGPEEDSQLGAFLDVDSRLAAHEPPALSPAPPPPPPPYPMAAPRGVRSAGKRGSPGASGAMPPAQAAMPAATRSAILFSGVPHPVGGEAVLFDSAGPGATVALPDAATLSRLRVEFAGGAAAPESLDQGLSLLLFVGDLATPRARVRLADLVRQGGERPLHIARQPGQPLRLVLSDPAGVWASAAPRITVTLEWHPS
jgi:Ca-activated chloride channel family protein